ncbi:hypothetical protein HPB47_010464 [Ixodes persulcatus]|uniref:Uncharacterized protein n=1 Tax=Ixodes persulcatus TaxID=34615 RepID=A0AC60NZ17_IXOPE|nr:hypothetical protein HPB47_010464 [Ixodes persulcatus]
MCRKCLRYPGDAMVDPGKEAGGTAPTCPELVKALCVLHNFLMAQNKGNENSYCGPGYADSMNGVGGRQGGQWRQDISQLPLQLARTLARNFAHVARGVRDLNKDYFSSSAGKVSWQQAVLQR